jgi:hypothetical protein
LLQGGAASSVITLASPVDGDASLITSSGTTARSIPVTSGRGVVATSEASSCSVGRMFGSAHAASTVESSAPRRWVEVIGFVTGEVLTFDE